MKNGVNEHTIDAANTYCGFSVTFNLWAVSIFFREVKCQRRYVQLRLNNTVKTFFHFIRPVIILESFDWIGSTKVGCQRYIFLEDGSSVAPRRRMHQCQGRLFLRAVGRRRRCHAVSLRILHLSPSHTMSLSVSSTSELKGQQRTDTFSRRKVFSMCMFWSGGSLGWVLDIVLRLSYRLVTKLKLLVETILKLTKRLRVPAFEIKGVRNTPYFRTLPSLNWFPFVLRSKRSLQCVGEHLESRLRLYGPRDNQSLGWFIITTTFGNIEFLGITGIHFENFQSKSTRIHFVKSTGFMKNLNFRSDASTLLL